MGPGLGIEMILPGYMIDTNISFAFNTVNDPAPADSVMEDDATSTITSQSRVNGKKSAIQ